MSGWAECDVVVVGGIECTVESEHVHWIDDSDAVSLEEVSLVSGSFDAERRAEVVGCGD